MASLLGKVPTLAGRIPTVARGVDVLRKAGLFNPLRLDDALRSTVTMRRWGPVTGAVRVAAGHNPDGLAIVDERTEHTFAELDRESNALARAWREAGVRQGSTIGIVCRDHYGMVLAMVAAGKTGAKALLGNTGFSKPQLHDVAEREGVTIAVYDEEFSELMSALPDGVTRYLAWVDEPDAEHEVPTLAETVAASSDAEVPVPDKAGGIVLLTSGTTGTPKGAQREVRSPLAAAEFLDRIPLRSGETTLICAPIFHGTGLSQFLITLALGSTTVLRRRFDPEAALNSIQRYRASALVVVPTMLQRILDLGEQTLARYDTSSLRIVFTAGSALSPELGNRATEVFGQVIHNLYGSTEVAVASVATPEDWRRAPGTVGRCPVGCEVRLYDTAGNRVTAPNKQGRVFVRSGIAFSGYTGGGSKEEIDGLLSSGDVGHFDADGLLFIDGRDDDMIVSGGENVYPIEIENLLVEHAQVSDAAVIGVPDDEFGQRLKAFVVTEPGAKVDAEEIKAYVKANLARYKVPRDVTFIEELPRNPTGKVLRNKLAQS
ncbi:acyl-CoA synthetase [Sciscionella sediminilitoris]|uniref:acyl-CoA synthetase n=1 Tax=Sciscionella sediminilitoris TaxID=1445613 RepID=UPI0004DF0716|nr:acyl-CoA synthetase [Sciscionella sp. SE31]